MPWRKVQERRREEERVRREGITLRVEEIIRRDLLRTLIKARSDGDGTFVAIQGPALQNLWLRGRGMETDFRPLRARRDEPLFLVCRGRRWQVGDVIACDKIVYRYEP